MDVEETRNTMNSFNTLLDNKTVLITGGDWFVWSCVCRSYIIIKFNGHYNYLF